MKFVSENIVDINDYFAGIFNGILLLSIWFSGIVLFLLLRELKLPAWFAIPVAAGLPFLSPQMERFVGHYGLSHAFVIPLILYLFLRWEKEPKWRYSIGIGATIIISSLMHTYFLGMTVFLIGGYLFFRFLLGPKTWLRLKHFSLHALPQLIIPVGIMAFLIFYFDQVPDRSEYPYGFLAYRARWQGVFLPVELGYFSSLWHKYLPPLNVESKAYIGTVSSLFLVYSFFVILIKNQRKKFFLPLEKSGKWFSSNLISTLLILLFAMGIPFIFSWATHWLDHLGFVRQFRATGRFSWAFFYFINIAVFFFLYHQFARLKNLRLRYALLALILGFFLYESMQSAFKKHYDLWDHAPFDLAENRDSTSWLDEVDVQQYQAILPLPYYHLGSENFWINPKDQTQQQSLIASVQSGLPLMSCFMTRTSISQTFKSIEFTLEPYRIPKIISELPNKKPILLWIYKKEFKKWGAAYEFFFEMAPKIYENEAVQIHHLPLSAYEAYIEKSKAEIQAEISLLPPDLSESLNSSTVYFSDTSKQFVIEHFDDKKSDKNYRGAGAWQAEARHGWPFFDGFIPNSKKGEFYHIYVWSYIHLDRYPKNWLIIEEWDEQNGQRLQRAGIDAKHKIIALDNGWGLYKVLYKPKKDNSRLKLFFSNSELKSEPLFVDELLILHHTHRLYLKKNMEVMKNGKWY